MSKEEEMSAKEITYKAMNDLWAMEGMIQLMESILADMPTKEMMMAMLREMRESRGNLEDAVKEFTTVDVRKARLES